MNDESRDDATDRPVSLNNEAGQNIAVFVRAYPPPLPPLLPASNIVPDARVGVWLVPWGSNSVGGIIFCCPCTMTEGGRRRPVKGDCMGDKMWQTAVYRNGGISRLRLV